MEAEAKANFGALPVIVEPPDADDAAKLDVERQICELEQVG